MRKLSLQVEKETHLSAESRQEVTDSGWGALELTWWEVTIGISEREVTGVDDRCAWSVGEMGVKEDMKLMV